MMDNTKCAVNFHNKNNSQNIIKITLHHICEILKNCLGPYGSTTIIQDRHFNHIITKDGYNIIKNLKFDHPISKTILDLIVKISRTQVRNVGDGSTSAIILANMLYKSMEKILKEYNIATKDLISMIKIIEDELIKKILEISKPITDENLEVTIKNIAGIANNNDQSIGDFIGNIYKQHGKYINVNLSIHNKKEDSYETISGIEHFRGHIHHIFVNTSDNKECHFEDPLIFATENELTVEDCDLVVHVINKALEEFKKPLVIIAKGYDSYIFNLLVSNKLKNKEKFQICPIDVSVNSENRYEKFVDLITYLGCKSYNRFDHAILLKEDNGIFGNKFIGMCKSFRSTEMKSTFIKGSGSKKEIEGRISKITEDLEKYLREEEQNYERSSVYYEFKRRIANLSHSMVNIKVGGSTDLERESRMHLFEDAIYACQSAIQYGYVVGGNLISVKLLSKEDLLKSIKDRFSNEIEVLKLKILDRNIMDRLILSVKESFLKVYKYVLLNANISVGEINKIVIECLNREAIYNIKSREYETDILTNIINSSETDIQIIKSCFSIISLICTSNQFVSVDDGYNSISLVVDEDPNEKSSV